MHARIEVLQAIFIFFISHLTGVTGAHFSSSGFCLIYAYDSVIFHNLMHLTGRQRKHIDDTNADSSFCT